MSADCIQESVHHPGEERIYDCRRLKLVNGRSATISELRQIGGPVVGMTREINFQGRVTGKKRPSAGKIA